MGTKPRINIRMNREPFILNFLALYEANNGMLCHSYWWEVFEYSLWHYILPDLKLLSYLPSRCRREVIRAVIEKFIMALFNKMDSGKEVKSTSSACKLTSSAWIWYHSFSREIFSFGKFFGWEHFFKNCGPFCIRGSN